MRFWPWRSEGPDHAETHGVVQSRPPSLNGDNADGARGLATVESPEPVELPPVNTGISVDDLEAVVRAASADTHVDLAELAERVDRLLAELAKLGREQFRATTLLEGHDAVLEELAEGWREQEELRAAQAAQQRVTRAEIEAQARLAFIKELLPVADALDASTRAAQNLVAALQNTPAPAEPASFRSDGRPWWQRWLSPEPATPDPLNQVEPARPHIDEHARAVDAWLQGLGLIQERLRALFDREGVRPICALGEPFDPHRHLAVAVSDAHDAPNGIVVAEDLRGYTVGERVLRHAEVVVARSNSTVQPESDQQS